MRTLRFYPPVDWLHDTGRNYQFLGFLKMFEVLEEHVNSPDAKMIEIGSYMGESTMLFAASGLFKTVYSVDPLSGPHNAIGLGHDWNTVRRVYNNNLEYFENVIHIEDYSYNVADRFEDGSIDFLYIDGGHDRDDIKKDITNYLPKLNKETGIIAGHDYNKFDWWEVAEVIDELIGEPEYVFMDTSWLSFVKNIKN